jgi:hypothetical protein
MQDHLTWEDVPSQGDLAYAEGYALGDCPYPHGSEDGDRWRKAWITEDYVADFQSGRRQEREQEIAREAAAYAQPPEIARVDELIDSFGEPKVPSTAFMGKLALDHFVALRQRMVGYSVDVKQDVRGPQGFTILDDDRLDAAAYAWVPDPDVWHPVRRRIPVPKSATSHARDAIIDRGGLLTGIVGDRRYEQQLHHQARFQEYARQQALARGRDLFRTGIA